MYNSFEIGAFGEKESAKFLKRHGYHLVSRNFKTTFGEIDIIARKRDILAFVEVKTRSNLSKGTPKVYVDEEKVNRIRRTAQYFMQVYQPQLKPRIDVIEVYLSDMEHTLSVERIVHTEGVY